MTSVTYSIQPPLEPPAIPYFQAAPIYLARNLKPIPVRGKILLVKGATGARGVVTERKIKDEWMREFPDAGTALRAEGWVGIDCDEYGDKHGAAQLKELESWAPFAEGRNELFTNPVLTSIAQAHERSVAQVVLRWLIQREIVVIPKSVRKDRMEENFDVFGFELSADQMTQIAALELGHSQFHDHRSSETVDRLVSIQLDES